jgi:hypothetical protein
VGAAADQALTRATEQREALGHRQDLHERLTELGMAVPARA